MRFPARVMEEPRSRGALLALALVTEDEPAGDSQVSGSLGCSDHGVVEFRVRKGGSRAKGRTTALAFSTADFNLVRDP